MSNDLILIDVDGLLKDSPYIKVSRNNDRNSALSREIPIAHAGKSGDNGGSGGKGLGGTDLIQEMVCDTYEGLRYAKSQRSPVAIVQSNSNTIHSF